MKISQKDKDYILISNDEVDSCEQCAASCDDKLCRSLQDYCTSVPYGYFKEVDNKFDFKIRRVDKYPTDVKFIEVDITFIGKIEGMPTREMYISAINEYFDANGEKRANKTPPESDTEAKNYEIEG